MSLKLYTKTGDRGQTSLLGGKKVSKADLRIESYGNVDELNSFLGLLRDQEAVQDEQSQQLYFIQERLFCIGSILATEDGFKGFDLPNVSDKDISKIERWIDSYEAEVPPLKTFILPGGHPSVSISHVCRTVCRRTERSIIALSNSSAVDPLILKFINRLSDYFFIFARVLSVRLQIEEVPWISSKD